MAKCVLSCQSMNQKVEVNLSDRLMDMSSVDFSKCIAVFEDGRYEIVFSCDHLMRTDTESVDVCVNGEKVGSIVPNQETDIIEGYTKYRDEIPAGQPFLLHYDLVVLSFIVTSSDGITREYFSDFMLCVSKSQEDATNIQNMLQEIILYGDSQVGEWIFANSERTASNSLYEGKWNKRAYKSLSSYIQLLEQVIACYKSNFTYFKTQGKHTIKRSDVLVSYDSVKSISHDSFDWIMQNTDQLAVVPHTSGIHYNGKNYLPYHIRTDANIKSWDVYENRVVIGFLHTALLNAKQIYAEFDEDILNEERIITIIHGGFPKEYRASIITIKSLQISFCRILLGKLGQTIDTLQGIFNLYITLFDVPVSPLTNFPRKTSTFCEIRPYVQVFEIIVRWFQYGEYSLEKERLILQVKTLDKLFEYYCLLMLLRLLTDNGYQKADVEEPAFMYLYTADDYYQNEKDIANTYLLKKDNVSVTLYYQPVISSLRFENGISLYKTIKSKRPYYTPDFVIKFTHENGNEEYVVLDAKFSPRQVIQKQRLPDVIRKYSSDMSSAIDTYPPRMVWILQGRVNSNENPVYRYHNSLLALRYKPHTSYGIVSLNTIVEAKARFWNELCANIPWLK